MRLTIVYLTFRIHPRFEWFCSSLAREFRSTHDVSPEEVQVIVIDGRLWYDAHRHLGMLDAARGLIKFEHRAPKPSPWQGPSRQTQRDYFCPASARNTAFAYALAPHVAFVDDLSVLIPGWLEAHMHAAAQGYVLLGTVSKNKNIVVDAHGELVSFDEFPPGRDSRLGQITEIWQVCAGSWLFGGTFSTPLELALRVNGEDEITNSIGGDDYDFGMRLGRGGGAIRISRLCETIEDEDGHHTEGVIKITQGATLADYEDRSGAWTVSHDRPWDGPDGPCVSNYLLNRLMRETDRSWTIGNDYGLRHVREMILSGGEFPPVPIRPVRYWVNDQLLSEL
jgi:hypothetical protein